MVHSVNFKEVSSYNYGLPEAKKAKKDACCLWSIVSKIFNKISSLWSSLRGSCGCAKPVQKKYHYKTKHSSSSKLKKSTHKRHKKTSSSDTLKIRKKSEEIIPPNQNLEIFKEGDTRKDILLKDLACKMNTYATPPVQAFYDKFQALSLEEKKKFVQTPGIDLYEGVLQLAILNNNSVENICLLLDGLKKKQNLSLPYPKYGASPLHIAFDAFRVYAECYPNEVLQNLTLIIQELITRGARMEFPTGKALILQALKKSYGTKNYPLLCALVIYYFQRTKDPHEDIPEFIQELQMDEKNHEQFILSLRRINPFVMREDAPLFFTYGAPKPEKIPLAQGDKEAQTRAQTNQFLDRYLREDRIGTHLALCQTTRSSFFQEAILCGKKEFTKTMQATFVNNYQQWNNNSWIPPIHIPKNRTQEEIQNRKESYNFLKNKDIRTQHYILLNLSATQDWYQAILSGRRPLTEPMKQAFTDKYEKLTRALSPPDPQPQSEQEKAVLANTVRFLQDYFALDEQKGTEKNTKHALLSLSDDPVWHEELLSGKRALTDQDQLKFINFYRTEPVNSAKTKEQIKQENLHFLNSFQNKAAIREALLKCGTPPEAWKQSILSGERPFSKRAKATFTQHYKYITDKS